MDEIVGTIERITFQNDENGYVVLQLKQPKVKELTCVVGSLPGVKPGECLRLTGEWKNHLVHGRQFEAKGCKSERPADLVGVKKYLGSGLIKGIGPVFAEKIVAKFGMDTLDILDKSPEQLLSISGVGQKKIEVIKKYWSEQKNIREVMIFLQAHGVSPSWAQKIYKRFGDESIEIVTQNPFRLARDVFGVGFKTADQIAQKLGMKPDAPERIDAGLEFVLQDLSSNGHACYPERQFLIKAAEILETAELEKRLHALVEDRRIERLKIPQEGILVDFVWIKTLYNAESGIAAELKRIAKGFSNLRTVDTEKATGWAESKLGIELAPNQKLAVATALTEKVLIITGGPGTGKSTITNTILTISDQLTTRILLAAPTGRAAKRMTEICKKPAKTLHSLLEFNFQGGFKRNRDNPLDCDLIIIDEASMIDTLLMNSLLKALPTGCRVIFVGDIDQLPSVGAGNVLKDMIASQFIPTVILNEIFRQAAGSKIILNAHRINKGQVPELINRSDSDFFFIDAETPESALAQVLSLVTQRLPQKYNFNALKDIQVLAPMRKGIIGIENLNHCLQEKLNKNQNYISRAGRRFAAGDKVMQLRNNYEKEVFNGDIGLVLEIDITDETVVVDFEGKDVFYEFSELDELALAYAVSVHKYQGSEAPCVVLLVHTTHFKLLQRNLIYTGVTRGKQLVIIVGNKKGLSLAVKNEEVLKRHTGLEFFLSNFISSKHIDYSCQTSSDEKSSDSLEAVTPT